MQTASPTDTLTADLAHLSSIQLSEHCMLHHDLTVCNTCAGAKIAHNVLLTCAIASALKLPETICITDSYIDVIEYMQGPMNPPPCPLAPAHPKRCKQGQSDVQ